jgi:hypothetical protein
LNHLNGCGKSSQPFLHFAETRLMPRPHFPNAPGAVPGVTDLLNYACAASFNRPSSRSMNSNIV